MTGVMFSIGGAIWQAKQQPGRLGAEITGLDLARPLDELQLRALKAALAQCQAKSQIARKSAAEPALS